MRTFIFMPPLKNVTGGMNVIMQIAAQLHEASYPVFLVSNGELPQDLAAHFSVPILRLEEVRFRREDRWIVPEGWPAFLAPGLKAQSACAVYVQNWGFLHGILPENTGWADLPIRMLSVSRPVSIFIKETTGFNAPIIRPVIDAAIFHPGKKSSSYSPGKIKIAWMPRKNKHLANQIRIIFEAIIIRLNKQLPVWIPIDNISREDVAKVMRVADVFLSTGFPEGFGLPPLEAMACGCVVAGFTGMGGWEYMRNALPNGFKPPFPLSDVPWSANGFFAADGDVWGAALALKSAYDACLSASALPLIESGQKAAMWFNQERQAKEILDIWKSEGFWNEVL